MRFALAGAASALILFAACGDAEEEDMLSIATVTATATAEPSAVTTVGPPPTASPLETTAVYVNPVYGYSLDYPSSWFVQTDPGGYTIITSYDPATAKGIGGVGPGLKIDIMVTSDVQTPTLAQWIAERDAAAESIDPVTVVSTSQLTSPTSGVSRQIIVQGVPKWEYIFRVGTRVYAIAAFPSDSPLVSKFQSIIQSIDFVQ